MKHIKLYEEYSDDEIKGLLNDLEEVGLSYSPVLGRDYGFTTDFLPEPKDKTPVNLLFSPEAVDYMLKKGMIEHTGWREGEKDRVSRFIPKGEWEIEGAPYTKGKPVELGLIKREQSISKKNLHILTGEWRYATDVAGFGNAILKKLSPRTRLYCQNKFIEKFQKLVKERGPI
jgi:hypothetical protein